MNEYAKEGKRFLHTIKEYFDEYEKAVGGARNLFSRFSWDTTSKMPNPNKLISGLSHVKFPEGYVLPLTKCGMPGFDGYFAIGDEKEGVTDNDLTVFNSKMGAWQLTLLLVLAKHVMPLYWHANYIEWLPIFDDRALRNLRDSHERYSADFSDSYSFVPKDLPTESTVEWIGEDSKYKVVFHGWSDFGGYFEVVSDIVFPAEKQYVKVRDVKISTEINTLYSYRCGIMF